MAQNMLCLNCHYTGRPKTKTKGSVLIELALWICFIVPGVIYSLWRVASRIKVCPQCQAVNMIPIESPAAQRVLSK